MTESEWLACEDPARLLDFLLRKRSRKFRLAAVAACRDFSDFLTDARISEYLTEEHRREASKALEVAERFADGRATGVELEAARASAAAVTRALAQVAVALPSGDDDMRVGDASDVVAAIGEAASQQPEGVFSTLRMIPGTEFLVARTLREVFGPPTATSFSHGWLTATVTTLAQAIYNDRAFDRMPILADALEDAGCTNADMLSHCRGPGPHVLGCWVVDLLLAKE